MHEGREKGKNSDRANKLDFRNRRLIQGLAVQSGNRKRYDLNHHHNGRGRVADGVAEE